MERRKPQITEYSATKEKFFEVSMSELKIVTKLEVDGRLDEKGIAANNDLRLTTKEFAVGLGKDIVRDTQEWLLSGMTDFISVERLREWANFEKTPDWAEPNFQKTAKYFFEKKQREGLEKK
jgi:hypothetical protein